MAFNYFASQLRADRMIKKYGRRVVLRVGVTDVEAVGVEVDFTPQERQGKLINPVDRLFLLSAKDLAVVPDQHKHTLVTFVVPAVDPPVEEEHLRIVAPPGRFAPGGIKIYWELQVRA